MLKKDIKNFFNAIRHKDLATVKALMEADKDYLSVCSFAPPKRDDGQSGLQVAFKVGALDIAEYLIEAGADVNFMEESSVNVWRAPVLHDCIRQTIQSCFVLKRETEIFDKSLVLMQRMLEKGADPNARDSYGNSCLGIAILQTRQVTVASPDFMQAPEPSYPLHRLTDEEREIELTQLRRVFKLLIDFGADIDATDGRRLSAREDVQWKLAEFGLF